MTNLLDITTFARASSATYTDSNGIIQTATANTPRVGHHTWDGSQWVNQGLLLESVAATNLVTYGDFDTGWSNTNNTNTGTDTGPDGVSGSAYVNTSPDGNASFAFFSRAVPNDGATYTASVFVKKTTGAATFPAVGLLLIGGTTKTADWTINTDDGTLTERVLASNDPDQGRVENYGDYWRVSTTITNNTSGNTDLRFYIFPAVNMDGSGTFSFEAGSAVFYGPQLETGSIPSSYIPTSGSTATRAAETLTIPNPPWPATVEATGTELVTNGTFDTDVSGWTDYDPARGTTSWDSGALKLTNDGTGNHFVSQQITGLTVGQTYVLTANITASVGTNADVRVGNSNGTGNLGITSSGVGFKTLTFKPQLTSVWIQPSAIGGTGAGVYANFDNISVKEITPRGLAIAMDGLMTYADTGAIFEGVFFGWNGVDTTNSIFASLDTSSVNVGRIQFRQYSQSVLDLVVTGPEIYSPGINVPFSIASRHGDNFINGAVDGTALTADTTPVALPDLSATDLQLGYDFMGTIKTFRMWGADIGDTGISEASQ